MAERFLDVEVSRQTFTDVTIRIDDADPQFADLFDEKGNLNLRCFSHKALKEAVSLALQMPNQDWESNDDDDADFAVEAVKPNCREEALNYAVLDAATGKRYKPKP